MKQEAFARLLGISPATYQSLEHGRRNLTLRHAAELRRATGVHPQSIFTAVPLDFWRRPYTSESFQQWTRGKKKPVPSTPQQRAQQIAGWIELLLEAAGSQRAADQVFSAICGQITKVRNRFRLQEATDKLLRARPATFKVSAQDDELTRWIENAGLKPSRRDGKTLTFKMPAAWSPHFGPVAG